MPTDDASIVLRRIKLLDTPSGFLEAVRRFGECSSETPTAELFEIVGLDPANAFAGENFKGHDFSRDNLSGISFSGCVLDDIVAKAAQFTGSSFDGASLD